MRQLLCRFGWHKWGQWVTVGVIKRYQYSWDWKTRVPIGSSTYQRRDCAVCGKVQENA